MTITAFAKFEGGILPLDGDSFVRGREGEFDVFDLQFQLERFARPDGPVESSLSTLSLDVSRVDSTRPNMIEAIENGLRYDEVTIEVVSGGATPFVVQRYTLTDVRITGFEERLNTNSGLSLNFADLTLEAFSEDLVNPGTVLETSTLTYLSAEIDETASFSVAPFGVPGEPSATDRATSAFLDLSIFGAPDAGGPGSSNGGVFIEGNTEDVRFPDSFEVDDYLFAFETRPSGAAAAPALTPLVYDIDANDPALTQVLDEIFGSTGIGAAEFDVIADFRGNEVAHQKVEAEGDVTPTVFVRDDDHATRIAFEPASDIVFTATEVDETGTRFQNTVHDLDFTGDTRIDVPPLFPDEVGIRTESAGTAFLRISGIDGPTAESGDVPDKSFVLSGFGYGFGERADLDGDGTSTPTLLPLTVDFERVSDKFGDLYAALADDAQFETVELVRVNAADEVVERVTLLDANLQSMLLDSTYDPRATFGYEAVKVETFLKAGDPLNVNTFEFSADSNIGDQRVSAENTTLLPRFAEFGDLGPRELPADGNEERDYFLSFSSLLKGDTEDRVFSGEDAFDVETFRFDMERVPDGAGGTDLLLPTLVVELRPTDDSGSVVQEALANGNVIDFAKFSVREGASVLMASTLSKVQLQKVVEQANGLTELHLAYGLDRNNPATALSTEFFEPGADANEGATSALTLSHLDREDVILVEGRDADAPEGGVSDPSPFDLFLQIGDDPDIYKGAARQPGFEGQFLVSAMNLQTERELSTFVGQSEPVLPEQSLTLDLLPGQLGELDLMNDLATGETLPEVTLTRIRGTGPEKSELTLEGARIVRIESGNADVTRLALDYDNLVWADFTVGDDGILREAGNFETDDTPDGVRIVEGRTTDPDSGAGAFESLAFLDLSDVGVTGDSLSEGNEGQFTVFDWDLDLGAAIDVTNDAFGGERRLDLAPLQVTVSAFNPGLVDLLERTRDGTVLQGATLNVATFRPSGPPETFDRYNFSNITLLAAQQRGDVFDLELGYSILSRELREADDRTGVFAEFEGTIDFRTNDRIDGDDGANTLTGGFGNDTLFGGDGDDVIDGGPDNDEIDAGSGRGNDTYDGGDGIDLITFLSTSEGIVLDLAAGFARGAEIDEDRLTRIENVLLGTGADSATGDDEANDIDAGGGDDTIEGGAGDDTLDGGEGNDLVSFAGLATGGLLVDLKQGLARSDETGEDVLRDLERVLGSAFDDTLIGSDGDDTLEGGSGLDTIQGGAGADILIGGAGNDLMHGTLFDLDGDVLADFTPEDTLLIESGGVSLGDIVLTDASDQFTPGSATIRFVAVGDGGPVAEIGFDGAFRDALFRFDTGVEGDTSVTTGGDDALLTGAAERFSSAEIGLVDGGAGDDTIQATAEGATLVGGAGDDLLTGGDGTQTFFAGTGSDRIETGGGADRVLIRASDGGPGTRDVITGFGSDDVLHLVGFELDLLFDLGLAVTEAGLVLRPSDDQEILLEGFTLADARRGSASTEDIALPTLATLSEAAIAPAGTLDGIVFTFDGTEDRLIEGSEGNDILGGGSGNDTVVGLAGDDALDGNAGVDALLGGSGADTLRGGTEDDLLDGGAGADRMEGGAGDDTYIVDTAADTVRDSEGTDVVRLATTNTFRVAGTGVERVEAFDAEQEIFVLGDGGATEMAGGDADDILVSGGGADRMEGGGGADFFAFLQDGPAPSAVIVDFDADDKLLLDDRFFGLGNGQIDLRQLSFGEVLALVRDDLADFDSRTQQLSIDLDGRDGPGGLEVIATFEGRPLLTAGDVLLF